MSDLPRADVANALIEIEESIMAVHSLPAPARELLIGQIWGIRKRFDIPQPEGPIKEPDKPAVPAFHERRGLLDDEIASRLLHAACYRSARIAADQNLTYTEKTGKVKEQFRGVVGFGK